MGVTGELKVQKSTFIWNISDFSEIQRAIGDSIISPTFQLTTPGQEEHKWQIELYPFGDSKDTHDFLSLYLILIPHSSKAIDEKYHYEFSILDNSNNYVNLHKCESINRFCKEDRSWGFDDFIERDELFCKRDSLLVNDRLKIACFIHVNPCQDIYLDKSINSLVYDHQLNKSNNSLVHQYHNLFSSEEFSDLTILIGGKEIKTHKNILAASSKVFSAMLKHDMKESNTNTLTIDDIEYEVMEEFLLFLYCRKQVSDKNAKSLLEVADKYDINDLKSECEKILWDCIKIDEACEILCVADRHNCPKLCSDIINYIITNGKKVVKTKAFEELSTKNPNLLKEIFRTSVEK